MEINNLEFPKKNDGGGYEDKFNPSDSWDLHLVEIAKSLKGSPKRVTNEEYFNIGVDFVSGREYRDDFGAWNPGQGDWMLDMPEKIADFDKNLINGCYRVQLDFCAVGQPDGPMTPGHIWAVRLWDQKEDKEILGSRVFSNKLSYGVTKVIEKIPEWGRAIWETLEEKEKKYLSRLIISFDREFENIDKSHHPYEKHLALMLRQNLSLFSEILDIYGNAQSWTNAKMKEGLPVTEIIKTLADFLNKSNDLIQKEQVKRDSLNNPEEFGSDEGDGWMKPPNWKG